MGMPSSCRRSSSRVSPCRPRLRLPSRRGLAVPESVATEVVTVVVTGVYYGLARVAEVRLSPLWGWLLGLPKAPTYANVTEYDPRHDKN